MARNPQCMVEGHRGMRPGGTLARFLHKHRGIRWKGALPQLTIPQIVRWAEAFHERTGRWPNDTDGAIPEALG